MGTNSSATSGTGVGGTLTMSSNQTYYATWKKAAITRTMTYNCNGGSGTPADKVEEAVQNGIAKVNICTEFIVAFGKEYIRAQEAPRIG